MVDLVSLGERRWHLTGGDDGLDRCGGHGECDLVGPRAVAVGLFDVRGAHPRVVGADVEPAVWDRLSHVGVWGVVDASPCGLTLELTFFAAIGVVAHQLPLFFAVPVVHRLGRTEMFDGGVIDLNELGVLVGVQGSLGDLGVRPEAVTQVMEEIADQVRSGFVAETGELCNKDQRRLQRLAQRANRVPLLAG